MRSEDGVVGVYTRETVERALELHFPGRWRPDGIPGSRGYTLSTFVGDVRMKNLKEAYVAVVAAAEAKRIADKKEEGR